MSGSTDITQSLPYRLGTKSAIAFLGQEAGDAYDHAQHLVQPRRGRLQCFIKQIGRLDLVRIEGPPCIQTRTGTPHPQQAGDTPHLIRCMTSVCWPSLSPPQYSLISFLARRFRCASPGSNFPISVAVHAVDLITNCAPPKGKSKPESAPVYRECGKSLHVDEFLDGDQWSVSLRYYAVNKSCPPVFCAGRSRRINKQCKRTAPK
jgi:hypothetical protein